jgi:predicted small integral membrane protein
MLLPLIFAFKGLIFPEELQPPLSSILRLVENQVLVAIGILGWIVYGRKESGWYSVWLYMLVSLTALQGISSGSLETALAPIGVLFIVRWLHTQRIAIVPILATLGMILFLSPVKADYRQKVWFGEAPETANMTSSQKAFFWIGQATEYWGDTFSGGRDLTEATASATGRADFIHQVAHIHSLTPSVVPYQFGETYSYFLVAFIPRILWPDKPLTGNANAFYAVTYGITDEEGAKRTTFGVSFLGEAFINFGWFGVLLIMLLQGMIISLLQHIFGGPQSGPGGAAVFIAFFIFFLNGIGSSAEILFGNILQNLLCGYFLLVWARQKSAPLLRVRRPIVLEQES